MDWHKDPQGFGQNFQIILGLTAFLHPHLRALGVAPDPFLQKT